MKTALKRFVSVLVIMAMFSTVFVNGAFADASVRVDGDTTIDMSAVTPSKIGQQTSVTDLKEKTAVPVYSSGTFTTSSNYQYFEFKVNVTKPGFYTLYLTAMASAASKRAFMYVDGERCAYFGDKTYSNVPYGVTLSNTEVSEAPMGSVNLSEGEHTVRVVVQSACTTTLSTIHFEYNTYVSNKAESAVLSADNSEKAETAYMKEASGYYIGGHKLSKLTANTSYVEVTFVAPKTGEYELDFLGISNSSLYLPTHVEAYVDNTVVNEDINLNGEEVSTLTTYNVTNSIRLTSGEHKLKLLATSVTNDYSIIPITTVKLTYIPSGAITVIEGPNLVSEQSAQTFYPKNISGITFTGAANTTGYANKNSDTGVVTSFGSVTINPDKTYTDADGNYVFLAKHDTANNLKGCVNIPINVLAAGNYDVTVNYYISPDSSYDKTSAWLVKVNGEGIAYTNAHGTNGSSNSEHMTLEAGSADFTAGENVISFELSELEIYGRMITVESIVLTPNKDQKTYINPNCMTINSKSDIISKSIAYNGTSGAPWVVTKFETASAPKAGETYIEFTIDAPFAGDYTITFDKVGLLSGGTKTGGKWNVAINGGAETLVDFTRDNMSKVQIEVSATLNEGSNTMRLTYSATDSATGVATQDYGFFLTGITLTPNAADIPDTAGSTITSMPEEGTYYAYTTIKNDTADNKSIALVAAVYDEVDGIPVLKNAKYTTETLATGEVKEISTSITVESGIINGSIKLFVWEDLEDLCNPLIAPTEIN